MALIFKDKPLTIGFLQIPSDYILDSHIHGILCQIPNVRWRFQKMMWEPLNGIINPEYFEKNAEKIRDTASIFLDSGYGKCDIITMACTSLSVIIGSENIVKLINPPYDCTVNTMADSLKIAIYTIWKGRKIPPPPIPSPPIPSPPIRIVFITPYVKSVHNSMVDFFNEDPHVNIIWDESFNLETDSKTSSLSPHCIFNKVVELTHNCTVPQAVVLCCSAMDVMEYGFIDKLENVIGIPVLTSIQASAWHTLQDSRLQDHAYRVQGFGSLFKHSLY
jgi:maleate cis-trans isomerase